MVLSGTGGPVFSDDVESGNTGWTADGWTIFGGTILGTAFQFYMLEWRIPTGFDLGMNAWPNWLIPYPPTEFIQATPGMLVWYRNSRYNDNWVGLHPGAGFLLPIDSHPALLWQSADTSPLITRYQMADATFAPWNTLPFTITAFEVTTTHGPLAGVPLFDDAFGYYDLSYPNPLNPDPWFATGAITPTLGLKVRVIDGNKTGARVKVDFGAYAP
jgi:immune inhibitor A